MNNVLPRFPFSRRSSVILQWLGILVTALAAMHWMPQVSAQSIAVTSSGFDNLPDHLFYFKHSEVVLWLDANRHTVWRSESGGKQWDQVTDIPVREAAFMFQHPYDNDRAYVLSGGKTHWKTEDKGKTWQTFQTPIEPASRPQLSFHAQRPNYVLFMGFKCDLEGWLGVNCGDEVYYTLNNFEEVKLLRSHVTSCIWSLSDPQFENAPVKEVMCVESPKKGGIDMLQSPSDLRLVQSEDFFQTVQPVDFSTGTNVHGVVAVSTMNRFIVAAAKPSLLDPNMDLYISQDGENWHEAVFPNGAQLMERAYTVVESTGQSLMLDVLSSADATFGSLYKSNSNGTFFVHSLNYTNRNQLGIVDFERIQGVEGIMLANIVANHERVATGSGQKEIQTRISFDDGATWSPITHVKTTQGDPMPCSKGSDCALQLHSITSPHNIGRVYSSEAAVGVLMAVGNFGSSLLEYDECDTYLSTDGGLSWRMVREGAHKYEFGDAGTLLVLVDDEKEIDHVWWSKDRGLNWQKHELGTRIRAHYLTTDPKSTSRSFMLIGTSRGSASRVLTLHLDFTQVSLRQCQLLKDNDEKSDFERWYARDLTPGPDCLLGHEQMFYRRKADRDCYVGHDFEEPVSEMKDCPCTAADFECDYNFVRGADGQCVRIGPDLLTEGLCQNPHDTYPGSSGYRLIPGNTCDMDAGVNLAEPVEQSCQSQDAHKPVTTQQKVHPPTAQPGDKDIQVYRTLLDSEIEQFSYFKDTAAILIRLRNGQVWRSENHGIQWKRVLEDAGNVHTFVMHEFDNTRAYCLLERDMYLTEDRGASWHRIELPLPPSYRVSQILDFHPQEKDWLLFIGEEASTPRHAEAFVSRNHGRQWDSLGMWVNKCIFGRDSKYEIQKETIYCAGFDSQHIGEEDKLFRTVDWGKNKESLFDGVLEFFVIQDFMAVAVNRHDNLMLYVSTNGQTFEEAQFPPNHYIDRNTFTVLQSNTHAVLLNIFKSVGLGRAHGALYKSNDKGIFYHLSLDDTNGDVSGIVDFEKMQAVDDIIMANQVINADELVGNREVAKRVRTMISWDDGNHWQSLTPPHNYDCNAKECTLNLHSRTDMHGPGAVFTAGGAPGLAMGVGNVGPELLPYEQSDTFLTRDGGHTWIVIQEGEHLYEFGDHGGLLVLINDEGPTNELLYSWDHGESWYFYKFSEDPVIVSTLTTDPESTTLRFILIGFTRGTRRAQFITTVDFSQVKLPKCVMDKGNKEKSDFESWMPKDSDGNDACLLGQKTAYWRRKSDRVCIVGEAFKQPEEVQEKCECRDIDFECDADFWRTPDGECMFYGRHPQRPTQCKPGDKFKGKSGYKKNPKSVCTGGIDLEKEKEWECGQGGDIQVTKMVFTNPVVDYIYFTDTDRVLVRTADGKVWLSENDGFSWVELLPDTKVIAMYQHPHFDERAYFITDGRTHYVTSDRASNLDKWHMQVGPIMNLGGNVLSYHNKDPNYLIYLGETDCDSFLSSSCHSEAFYSHDHGQSWMPFGTYMRNCMWGSSGGIEKADRHAIVCEEYRDKRGNQRSMLGNPVQLVSSTNYFSTKKVLFDDIIGATVFGKFYIVAVSAGGGGTMRLSVSLDTDTFASAKFPETINIAPEAFTIMESANTLWIHVSTNTNRGAEYGSILTSNSNGTYFVLSLENANRNEYGIVDFEKMQGIEGISIANKVSNPGEANMGNPKKLVTMITADAGAHWNPLTPPNQDSTGKSYDCSGKADCHLHLHCYSERQNSRDLFSLSSAVGLMVGVGNVGKSLTAYRAGDMFLTRDAGKSWFEIQKGPHLWEFADQGALLILVDSEEPTTVVKYTTDEGLTWNTFTFAKKNEAVKIQDIITQPDGTSQKYVLFGQERNTGKAVAYHLDFSTIHPTKCKMDISDADNDDFELWSPEDTRGEKCLFGRETKYYRRIRDRDCYIGEKLVQPHEEVRNCTCTAEDYECDFNFVRNEKNECVLVPGLAPVIPECDGSIPYYYMPTGYRKIAASTCEGGQELEKGEKRWCPGKSHGAMWIVYILAPIGGAVAIFFCLRYRRHGGSLGRIRLADGGMPHSVDFSSPIFAKVVSALVVVPIAILGLLSRIPIPHSLSDITDKFKNLPLPRFLRRRHRDYSPLGQDENAVDVLLDDYDGDDARLLDEAEDADEL